MIFVGLDIGGTSTRLVTIDGDGRIVEKLKVPTHAEQGVTGTIDGLIRAVEGMVKGSATGELKSIGIGITGPVDVSTGVVSNPYTLAGWPPTDIRAPFADAFGLPVSIDNDANVAAVGEWWLGSGRGVARMVMVTIGTGVGVATLINGQVQRSTSGQHGEAGHMILDPNGPECYCGARGCWEVMASGTALQRGAKLIAAEKNSPLLAKADDDIERVDNSLLFAAAAAGHKSALDVIDAAAKSIGQGLVNLASAVTPDLFVLSGGVMEHFEHFRPRVNSMMRQHAKMIPTDIPVLSASLGDDAGAVGAAKQARDSTGLFNA